MQRTAQTRRVVLRLNGTGCSVGTNVIRFHYLSLSVSLSLSISISISISIYLFPSPFLDLLISSFRRSEASRRRNVKRDMGNKEEEGGRGARSESLRKVPETKASRCSRCDDLIPVVQTAPRRSTLVADCFCCCDIRIINEDIVAIRVRSSGRFGKSRLRSSHERKTCSFSVRFRESSSTDKCSRAATHSMSYTVTISPVLLQPSPTAQLDTPSPHPSPAPYTVHDVL